MNDVQFRLSVTTDFPYTIPFTFATKLTVTLSQPQAATGFNLATKSFTSELSLIHSLYFFAVGWME